MSLIPKWLIVTILVFSFIGFLDATFLTIEHYNGGTLQCFIFDGCDEVLSSSYSAIGGIPTALFGAIYYLAILIATILYLDTKHDWALRFLAYIPIAGFVFSLWLIYLQLFIIEAICFYCVVSAITSTIIFVLGLCLWPYLKRKTE